MATELAAPTTNGNHLGQHAQGHDAPEAYASNYGHGVSNSVSSVGADSYGTQGTAVAAGDEDEPSKDEVGWMFVERYYRSLHDHPEKLHLFYNKKSQFVAGIEAEKVNIVIGRNAIADRIKDLDFKKCKVLLTNVDIQSSDKNIVLQVIGVMSNVGGSDNRKFIQTFILARQAVGYYVLNDMLRFTQDEIDDEDVVKEPAEEYAQQLNEGKAAPQESVPEPEASISELVSTGSLENQSEEAAHAVESAQVELPATENPKINGIGEYEEPVSTAATAVEDETEHSKALSTDLSGEGTAEGNHSTSKEIKESVAHTSGEKEPTTSTTSVPTSNETASTSATKSSAPKTWANIASSQSKNQSAATSANSSAQQTAVAAPTHSPSPAQATEEVTEASTAATPPSSSGWQTAGNDHAKRQSRPVSVSGDKPNVLAYVKYVTEKVDYDELKNALSKFGDLAYFDISRQKNCAFVEFATPAGYNAAIAANPHHVSGENIIVEERRPRAGAYGGSTFQQSRGNTNRPRGSFDGRGGNQGGRANFQRDANRGGGFNGRGGRGGNITPRGRGGSAAV